MKKLKLFDGKILEGELGYDSQTGWSIPNDVQSVEFEDGTVLINPDFDIEIVKSKKIKDLQSTIIDLQIRKDAGVSAGVSVSDIDNDISVLTQKIAEISNIGVA